LFIGSMAINRVDEWVPGAGSVVSWHASPASLAKAEQATVSPVPPSYMQAQHIRGFCEFAGRGLDYSRLIIISWDEPGRCDARAMNYVVNSHLRRHDTYRSWFQYQDADHIVRRTISDPGDIEFIPTHHGEMTPEEWQANILATPSPLNWDCFSFGLIQREDHFTFYVAIDHVHIDPVLMAVLFVEIHKMYAIVVEGGAPIALPPPSGYENYCLGQQDYTSSLTLESPQVRTWIEFAERNGGTLPEFALPLGDTSPDPGGDAMVVELMDEERTARFESACTSGGVRFIGGVLACAALTQYQLTGAEIYYGMTPTDLRTTPAEFMTMGWFTGMIPVTVPVTATSFGETAHAAQASFDSNIKLANVPFDRVLQLAPWLHRSQRGAPMLSYLDAGVPPLSSVVASQLDGLNVATYFDARTPAHVCMWVGRVYDKTTLTVFFPDNPIARESVTLYVDAMKSVYAAVAEGNDDIACLCEVAQA
jgi:hypothetical protein